VGKTLDSNGQKAFAERVAAARSGDTINLDEGFAEEKETVAVRKNLVINSGRYARLPANLKIAGSVRVQLRGLVSDKLVSVEEGSHLLVHDCHFLGDDSAVVIAGQGARGEVSKSSFKDLTGSGVIARDAGYALATDCVFERTGQPAFAVRGQGARGEVSNGSFKDLKRHGVVAVNGGHASATDCVFERMAGRNNSAFFVTGQGARGEVNNSSFNDLESNGVLAVDGGHASATDCVFERIGWEPLYESAFEVRVQGSHGEVNKSIFKDLKNHGVVAKRGGHASARECIFERIESGALYVEGQGARGEVNKSIFKELKKFGVQAHCDGQAFVDRCTFERAASTLRKFSTDYSSSRILVDGIAIECKFDTPLTAFDRSPISSAMAKLDSMIGLGSVKSEISTLVAVAEAEKKRRDAGMPATDLTLHLAFAGNPGTGKTTVARIVGEIYRDLGLLDRGHVVAVNRELLVAGFIGQTALKTQEKINEAIDGVLFIDEAHQLWKPETPNDYGSEAIGTILTAMEDQRARLVVIVAGYSKEIRRFIGSDPGLKRRFKRTIYFEDYSAEELTAIYRSMADQSKMTITPAAKEPLEATIREMVRIKDEHFGNGGDVRLLYQGTIERQARRLQAEPHADPAVIEADDIPPMSEGRQANLDRCLKRLDDMIGLSAVKSEVKKLVNVALANEKRARRSLRPHPIALHMVFTGNPGTGKTTVARLMGDIFRALGLLRTGHLIETHRNGLVAGNQGPAQRTHDVIKDSIGGVLFIDEAYALVTDSVGQEAVNTLLKEMEDNRDRLAVIVAGYTEDMKRFICSNLGLERRFTRYIHFDDYSVDELVAIFLFIAAEHEMTVDAAAQAAVRGACECMHQAKGRGFGNGGAVRTLFETTLENQSVRINATNDPELSKIIVDDIPASV
jgi:SpoVK/Ycf46/Vps4 family AAA+-type ATPase